MVPESPARPSRRKVAGNAAYREVEGDIRARLLEIKGHMSIAAFADTVRLNHETVRRAVRGGTIATELVLRVCARYDVSADWLLFGAGARRSVASTLLIEVQHPESKPIAPRDDEVGQQSASAGRNGDPVDGMAASTSRSD